MSTRARPYLILTSLFVLALGACASSTQETSTSVEQGSQQIETTIAATTTSPSTTVPVDDGEELAVLTERDVVYQVDDQGEWTMDIFYPDGDGPWPLVVVYHGMTTSRATSEAQMIARGGAVAVAPQWVKELPPTMTHEDYISGDLFDRAACAVGSAQAVAPDFGGDPAHTTVVGFSAGMHPTAWAGLGVQRDLVCIAPTLYQPVGVVMGDSQFLFYEDGWDASLTDPESQAADTVDRLINPERWGVPDDLSVYLWTSDYVHGREITNPPSDDSWIMSRDTTGTLVDDLDALGAFDDEWIGWMDNGLLMEARMSSVGIDVEHEAVGGGHAYGDTVYAAINELIHRSG